jgi:HPr kinase/phosphorylase
MQIHASCAARDGAAVLVTGPSGSGKSDLVLRLLDHGFTLVADDRVILTDNVATAPDVLKGLLEVRGLGILRLDHLDAAVVRLVAQLLPGGARERLPHPRMQEGLGVPKIDLDPWQASAPSRVSMALRCATGSVEQVVGAMTE